MNTGYLMMLLADVGMAIDFCLDKKYQQLSGTSMRSGLRYNILWGLMVSVIFCVINSFSTGSLIPTLTPFSVIMGAVYALCIVAYKVIGLKILKRGGVSIYTMFLMTGGMIVPYIYGVVMLGESIFPSLLGLIIVIGAVITAYYGSLQISKKGLILCIVVFFINGIGSVISKVHQIETVLPIVSPMEFFIIYSFLRSVLSLIAYPVATRTDSEKTTTSPAAVGIVGISAIISGGFYLIIFFYTKTLPATVIFPIMTGGTILFSILASKIVFKEKLTKTMIAGVILCIVGLLLFI